MFEELCRTSSDYDFFLKWFGDATEYAAEAAAVVKYQNIDQNSLDMVQRFYETTFKKSRFLADKFGNEIETLLDKLTYNNARFNEEALDKYIKEVENRRLKGNYLQEAKKELSEIIDKEAYDKINQDSIEDLQEYKRKVKKKVLVGQYMITINERIKELDDKYF